MIVTQQCFFRLTAKNDYDSIESLRSAFNENALLVAFGCVNGYGEIGNLISENKNILAPYISYSSLEDLVPVIVQDIINM